MKRAPPTSKNESPQASASQPRHYWEGDARWLSECTPEYIELPGWQQSTKQIRRFDLLPVQAQAYVRKLEELVGVRVGYVSVGPGRDEIIQTPGS